MSHARRFLFDSMSLEGTRRLGRALGEVAAPGLVVGLIGTLGAGKTAFVRAVAEGLGVDDPRVVHSPTFLLIQEYAGRLPVYHFDVYRLKTPGDFLDLGVEEYFDGDGVSLIEWSDRVQTMLPAERIDVAIEIIGNSERRFDARLVGLRFAALFDRWLASLSGAVDASSPRAH
jgi:tRNA threonylcarbamoyladenosine biosynthesis protein TsaE